MYNYRQTVIAPRRLALVTLVLEKSNFLSGDVYVGKPL